MKIEPMEEYSEAKIYKSKPELRNSNVNADNPAREFSVALAASNTS